MVTLRCLPMFMQLMGNLFLILFLLLIFFANSASYLNSPSHFFISVTLAFPDKKPIHTVVIGDELVSYAQEHELDANATTTRACESTGRVRRTGALYAQMSKLTS